jgi:hypothetical protein
LGRKCLRKSGSPYGYRQILHTRGRIATPSIAAFTPSSSSTASTSPRSGSAGGPWLEDLWIARYCCNRTRDAVYRFHNFTKKVNNIYPRYSRPLFQQLKPHFLYVAVNATDYGMDGMRRVNSDVPWNILILSASGRGHIPVMLHHKSQPPVDALPKKNDIIFLEKQGRQPRIRALDTS